MGIGERLGDLLEDLQEPRRVGLRVRAFLEQGPQRAALDQLHREKWPTICQSADFMDGRNSGVLELARDAGFVEKTCLLDRITLSQHDLNRQRALKVRVDRPQDRSHATAGNLTQHLVELPGKYPLRLGRL